MWCREQLGELQEKKDELEELGAHILALSVDGPQPGRELKAAYNIEYPLLSDEELMVSSAYHLYDLHGDGVAAPAVFVIDSDGIIRWRYIGEDFTDRPPINAISGALQALN